MTTGRQSITAVSLFVSASMAPLLFVTSCVVLTVLYPETAVFLTNNNTTQVVASVVAENGEMTFDSRAFFEHQNLTSSIAQDVAIGTLTSTDNYQPDQPLHIVTALTTLVGAYAIGSLCCWLEQQIVLNYD